MKKISDTFSKTALKKAFALCAAGVMLLSNRSPAQIATQAVPLSISNYSQLAGSQYIQQIPLSLPAHTQQRQTKTTGKHALNPVIIGDVSKVDISFNSTGTMAALQDGSKIWRLQISMPGAKALGLYYDQFKLPAGVKYFLFNENRKQVLGAYTSQSNPNGGSWVTEKVQGDVITLELDIPTGVNVNDIILHINNVADFYAAISYLDAYNTAGNTSKTTGGPYYPFNGSSTCEINAACPLGDSFPEQRKATVAFEYLIGGTSVAAASATLINNTKQDCTPLLLTASHTEQTNSTADSTFSQWLFYFNYETPTCTYTGAQPTPLTMTGATFLSRSSYNVASDTLNGDFLLLKLKTNVPASYGAYFAGWDLDTTVTTGTFTSFHHPSGDVKKVSMATTIDADGSVYGQPGSHWAMLFSQGGMEEGSSGSGLFNTSGHLIGMCSAGAPYEATCTDTNFVGKEMNNYALYGKLARDWTYTFETPSTPQTRLKDWLDPTNTGLTKIDAIPAVCDAATGVQQQINENGTINVFPNPTDGITYASVSFSEATTLKIDVFNAIGEHISGQSFSNVTTGNYKIDLSNYASGIYMVLINTGKMQVTKKVFLIK